MKVGEEIIFENTKMRITEIRPDGTFTFKPFYFEDGIWKEHHQTNRWKAFMRETELKNGIVCKNCGDTVYL